MNGSQHRQPIMMTEPDITACTPLDAALTLARLGLRVLPITPGKKHPPIPGWQDAATTNPDTITSWWTDLYRGHGVGIATGPGSKVWVLDLDVANGKKGRESLEALFVIHGRLPSTVAAITGTGGGHWYFRWDPQRPITNGMATQLPEGLDIRGQGGQVVAPPTIHPAGGTYTWAPGRAPWEIDVADAPDWLYELLRPAQVEQPAPPPTPPAPRISDPDGDSPAELVRRTHNWHHELGRDGWTEMHTRGGDSYWCRPGKNPRDGHSAVLHEPDGPLVIFTTDVPPGLAHVGRPTSDGSGRSVTLFDYVAAYRHHGDRAALARDIRRTQPPTTAAVSSTAVTVPVHASDPPEAPGEDPWALFGAWKPADLATYLDPDWKPEPPTLLQRDDGRALWYRGNVNWLHGASGEGKTWVALVAVAQELNAGRDVVWVHYEDPLPDKITNRLVLLGVDRATIIERFHVCCVGSASMVDGIPFLRAVISHYSADLVVIDSIGEAIGSDGIAVKEDEKFVHWIHHTCRVLAADGGTVLGIDHLPIGDPARLDPVGSFRKKAATTGSMFLAESPNPPTQGKAGYIKLTCAKDRSGVWSKGTVAAIIHLAPNPTGGLLWTVTAPRAETEAEGAAGEPIEIICGRHATRIVVERGELARNQLEAAMIGVKARGTAKRQGIDFAVLQGWLEEVEGGRGARLYRAGPVELSTASDLLERWGKKA